MLAQLGQDILTLLDQYGATYARGIINTLILAIVSTFFGCIIGFLCGIVQTIPRAKEDPAAKRVLLWILRAIIRVYVEVFRGTPMILQAVFIFYGLPYFTNNALQFTNLWAVSIAVVSINTGAYISESVRGGIFSVDPGQMEGARAIGMTHVQAMRKVVLPQALRNILPQIGNNYIINIKDSSVMFIIGFSEFFSVHRMVSGAVFKYFPSATIEMLGYLTVTLLSSILLRWVERRIDGKDAYELSDAPVAGGDRGPRAGTNEYNLMNNDQLVMAAGNYTFREKQDPKKGQ